jgi:hypothetical protein
VPGVGCAVKQAGDRDVGGNGRHLDQGHDDVGRGAARDAGDDIPDPAQQPQDVHVARRVVDEAGVGVEAAQAVVGRYRRPAREQPKVGTEALCGQQDVGDQQAECQAGQQNERNRRNAPERGNRTAGGR